MSGNNKKELLSRWLNKSKNTASGNTIGSKDIVPMPQDAPKRLSYGQKRLWMLQQLYPGNAFYNYAEVYKIKGVIKVPIFKSSIKAVVDRHDILRTTFAESENEIIQIVNNEGLFDFTFKSCTGIGSDEIEQKISQFAQENGGESFDLVKGPLVRIGLLQLSGDSYSLIVNMHHIITDKWSMRVFSEELAEIYNASILGHQSQLDPPKLQFADFAHWEQKRDIDKKQLDYWLNCLSGAPGILSLPFDYKRPQIPSHKGAFCKRHFEDSIAKKVDVLCKKYNTTHFVFYLTVFTILLQRFCRQDDILLGTPISNRSQSSLERMIGFFNETIVLRFNLDSQITFKDYLQVARKNVLNAFSNKDIPLELLIKELGVSRDVGINPLFQTMFLYHKVPEKQVWKGFDIDYETLDAGVSKFDLTLYVAEDENGFSATMEYATDLFDEKTIIRMHDCYAFLLSQITENPETLLSSLEITNLQEKNKIYELNKNDKAFPIDGGIHSYIIKQLEKNRNAKAVSFGKKSWTYDELIKNARKIAIRLDEMGVAKGDVVAVSTNRTIEMVGAILGVLMVGGVYMPLDPNYPDDRIKYMLLEAKSKFVLCLEGQEELFSSTQSELVFYQSFIESDNLSGSLSDVDIAGEDIAYLIFTSGSSGKPKGVMVTHENIIHSTLAREDFYKSGPKSFLLLSSFAFDSSMVGLFWTLCQGGNLILTPEKSEQDMVSLSKMISRHQVSHTLMLPSLYQILLSQSIAEDLGSLECVIVAGEACNTALCRDHFQKLPIAKLYNEYGPTETTVWCTGYEITLSDQNKTIPIGRAINSTDIFIVDQYGNMVPIGVPGEIYIGGRGVTKGYINRKDLTVNKFTKHNFEQEYPSLLYRSGDLGKLRSDGVIEFLGRVDHQIKIRGYRVELSEIQNVLKSIPDFHEIVVVAIKNSDQKLLNKAQSILAFYVSNDEVDVIKIKTHLSSLLPEYMIPSAFVKLDEIPKLPNGKYDYKYLEDKDISSNLEPETEYRRPRNDIEKALVDIWEEVLSTKPIGIDDNFFTLGGDSILSIQINGKAQNNGMKFPPNEIFKSQTISELAIQVQLTSEKENLEVFVGTMNTTPIQRWYLNNFNNKPGHWHLGVRFDLEDNFSKEVLSDVIKAIVERHEALRMVFDSRNIQNAKVDSYIDSYLDFMNLSDVDVSDQEGVIQNAIHAVCSSSDIYSGKLFKCLYFENIEFNKNSLVLLAHHLVVDQVSWYILVEEISKALSQRKDDITINLGAKSISYNQWALKLKDYIQSLDFKNDYDYWKAQFSNQTSEYHQEIKKSQESDVERLRYNVESNLGTKLINVLPEQFDAKINEILISAIARAIKKWRGITSLTIETEGHGREALDDNTTFYNSVGWFTSLYPIFLNMDEKRDSRNNLQYVKNKLRSIPSKGMTFGICKYLVEDETNSMFNYHADLLFNFLGKNTNLDSDILGKGKMLTLHMRSEKSERIHPIEINAFIDSGELILDCSYVKSYTNDSGFTTFLKEVEKELLDISDQSILNRHNYVPADFKDVDFGEEDLDDLFDQL